MLNFKKLINIKGNVFLLCCLLKDNFYEIFILLLRTWTAKTLLEKGLFAQANQRIPQKINLSRMHPNIYMYMMTGENFCVRHYYKYDVLSEWQLLWLQHAKYPDGCFKFRGLWQSHFTQAWGWWIYRKCLHQLWGAYNHSYARK